MCVHTVCVSCAGLSTHRGRMALQQLCRAWLANEVPDRLSISAAQLRQSLCCLAVGKPGGCSASCLPYMVACLKIRHLQGAEVVKVG